ncbi:MAG: hypothetical protein II943_06980 [Victivallales bacterium]|nr:hypothetical protein [Victivallales bacterium]
MKPLRHEPEMTRHPSQERKSMPFTLRRLPRHCRPLRARRLHLPSFTTFQSAETPATRAT